MFGYYARICALKGMPVVSLLLTPAGRQAIGISKVGEFEFNLLQASIAKTASDIEDLILDKNPFGSVCAAFISSQSTRENLEERFRKKLEILRANYSKGWSRRMGIDIFRIVNWMMKLPPEMERRFWRRIRSIERRGEMNWMCPIEKMFFEDGEKQGISKGLKQGIKKGIEQGIEQGIELGRRDAMAEMLGRQLKVRFGPLSATTRKRLLKAQPEQLAMWAEALIAARTLKDIFGK